MIFCHDIFPEILSPNGDDSPSSGYLFLHSVNPDVTEEQSHEARSVGECAIWCLQLIPGWICKSMAYTLLDKDGEQIVECTLLY